MTATHLEPVFTAINHNTSGWSTVHVRATNVFQGHSSDSHGQNPITVPFVEEIVTSLQERFYAWADVSARLADESFAAASETWPTE